MLYILTFVTYTHLWIGGHNKFVKVCTYSNKYIAEPKSNISGVEKEDRKVWVYPDDYCVEVKWFD